MFFSNRRKCCEMLKVKFRELPKCKSQLSNSQSIMKNLSLMYTDTYISVLIWRSIHLLKSWHGVFYFCKLSQTVFMWKVLSLKYYTIPVPQVKVSALPWGLWEHKNKHLPVAQTWHHSQQPVETGVKIFTKIPLLKLCFCFKSSLCSHHFLHETSWLSSEDMFTIGYCPSQLKFQTVTGKCGIIWFIDNLQKSVQSCLK